MIFRSFLSSGNIKYGISTYVFIILNSNGLQVTIPLPLGKKFKPQIDSNKELLPADYSPKTAILGREIYSCKWKSLNLSIRDIIYHMFVYKSLVSYI